MALAEGVQRVETAVGSAAEHLVLHLLIQLVVILVATRVVVFVAKKLGQTDVAGEILAGIILGPSVLGAIAPDAMHKIFDPQTAGIFVGFSQVGLVLLMFQIGLEFDFASNLRASKKSIAAVSIAGMVVPFACGLGSAGWFHQQMAEPRPALADFRLFFGIALSITAIPILGRIFMELRLSHTRVAALTIGAAAIDDVAGWLLLGVVTLLVQRQFSSTWLVLRIFALGAYVLFTWFIARPILRRVIRGHLSRFGTLQSSAIGGILVILFVSGTITSLIGVFAIIGGFVAGVALHQERPLVEEWKTRVSPVVNTLFLPIFFAYTGLRTDIGGLSNAHEWWVCFVVITIAFASKFSGAYVGARMTGESARSAAAIGVCMNTRALMELVAVNVGYDLGVLPRSMFTMLVIMAVASTYIATPLIRRLLRHESERAPASTDRTDSAPALG